MTRPAGEPDPAPASAGAASKHRAGTAQNIGVTPHAMAHGGEALARAEDGRAVFVPGGLPGEALKVRLIDEHAHYARGQLTDVPASPSPDRVHTAPCPHFGSWPARGLKPAAHCGGCQWQHVRYAAQLTFKAEVLVDTLRRIGGIEAPPVRPTEGMAEPWRYRNQVRLQVGPAGTGFVALDGQHIVPIALCHIAHPLVWELADALAGDMQAEAVTLRAGLATGDQMIVLEGLTDAMESIEVSMGASVIAVDADGALAVVAGRPYLVEHLAGHAFVVPAQSFFQVNTTMAEQLVARVRAVVPSGLGTLMDVHSGVGTFAVLLADRAAEVYAIESDTAAVAAAVDNAAGLTHVTLVEATAAEGLAHLALTPDVVVVDPPRTGLDTTTVRLLATQTRDTIVYVSCEPSTLARDARQFVSAGWHLTECWPLDMFPQTYHIESVNVFRR